MGQRRKEKTEACDGKGLKMVELEYRGEHHPIYLRPYYGYGMPISVSIQRLQGALMVWDGCAYGHKQDLMGSYGSNFNNL